jgi:hypothetical protein
MSVVASDILIFRKLTITHLVILSSVIFFFIKIFKFEKVNLTTEITVIQQVVDFLFGTDYVQCIQKIC